MTTRFGPEAKDGDYVIVLDANYMSRRAINYIAKVYKGKAYTGRTMYANGKRKYIHKIIAEVVIPEHFVPDDIKALIEEDIKIHT